MDDDAQSIREAEDAIANDRWDDARKILAPLVERKVPAALRLNVSFFEPSMPGEEADQRYVEGIFEAAELGDTEAKYLAGAMLDIGDYGVAQDKGRASIIFRDLANEGDTHCMWIYACELLWGKGSFDKDENLGLEYLNRAIEGGSSEACITKATIYHEGLFGLARDIRKRDLYRAKAKELEGDGYVYDPYA